MFVSSDVMDASLPLPPHNFCNTRLVILEQQPESCWAAAAAAAACWSSVNVVVRLYRQQVSREQSPS